MRLLLLRCRACAADAERRRRCSQEGPAGELHPCRGWCRSRSKVDVQVGQVVVVVDVGEVVVEAMFSVGDADFG